MIVRGAKGQIGPQGNDGPQGSDGPQGNDGPQGEHAIAFADASARGATTPAFIGQVGHQLDTHTLYYGTAQSAGSWTLFGLARTSSNLSDLADLATAQVNLGLGPWNLKPANNYFQNSPKLNTASGTGLNNYFSYSPIWKPSGWRPNRVAMQITTGSAGNARLAVYTMAPTNIGPDQLLFDSGDISTATSGLKEAVMSESLFPTYGCWLWCGVVLSASAVSVLIETNLAMAMLPTTVGALGVNNRVFNSATYGAWPSTAVYGVGVANTISSGLRRV